MCKYIELTTTRKQFIERFKITERDDHVFSTLEEAVRDALKRSFLDINFRTLHDKSDKYPKLNEDETITLFLINELSKVDFIKNFVEYFTKDFFSEEEFDVWHHEECQCFLDVLKLYYNDASYGKAQKIVNMMFKHLYCMNFEENKEKSKSGWIVLDERYFTHCHLTLDSFTLEWFYREVSEKWYSKQEKTTCGDTVIKGKINAWSNIEYRDDLVHSREERMKTYTEKATYRLMLLGTAQTYYHYSFLQDIIREFFEKTKTGVLKNKHDQDQLRKRKKKVFLTTLEQRKYIDNTPFQAEFCIWPEIQLHLTAEALFNQSIGQEKMLEKMRKMNLISEADDFEKASAIYKTMALDEKIKMLKEKIAILEEYSNCKNNTENFNGT